MVRTISKLSSDVLSCRLEWCPLTYDIITLCRETLLCSTSKIRVNLSLKESSETFRAQGDIKPV
jgi:hypothetical protein